MYLGAGTLTAASLQGPLTGKHVSDLVNLMKTGEAYVDIHTTRHPNGEIRGQISS